MGNNMQVYEVVYVPKKGEEGSTIVEHFPLTSRFPSRSLRAIHPRHKILSVRPCGQPLIDRGQYYYWILRFHYTPGPFMGNLGDDEISRKATLALCDAEAIVEMALTKFGVEYRPSYSWPNGSLYYVIRRTQNDVEELIPHLNDAMERVYNHPITLRWSFTDNKKRKHMRSTYGKQEVTVEEEDVSRIENPWETDPCKLDLLNYVDYFERDVSWRKFSKSEEDLNDPLHQAFRAGVEEAFGHLRLFQYRVRPPEYASFNADQPATNEECAAYVGAYALGKMLLTLRLPAGVSQKPWKLLLDEGDSHE